MSELATVCVVGSANIDLTFRTERLPSAGETVHARDFRFGCGGKGANQAVMAALLGARVQLVARVGNDPFGQQLVHNLHANGVNTDHVGVEDELPTGMASIFVDDGARNCIAVAGGANDALTPDHVRTAARSLRLAKVLLCQLETPLEATLEAFRIARSASVRTILNPAPARALPDELLELTDLCVPNETEAALLTDTGTNTPEGASAAAQSLRQRGARSVIVTLGSRGCLIDDGQGVEYFAARPVSAVDPTGAGDAFLGALAAALAEGVGLRDAVPRASAAAALSVTRAGAQASFPSRTEVEALLARDAGPSARAAGG